MKTNLKHSRPCQYRLFIMNLFLQCPIMFVATQQSSQILRFTKHTKKWTYEKIFIGPWLVHLIMPTTCDFSNSK